MNKLKIFVFTLFFFFVFLSGFAQYVESGQDPPKTKWKQITAKKFTVIYPVGFEEEAKKVAYLLMQIEKSQDSNFVKKKFKTKIILHNSSTISNGMVVLAPRRMELYTCPEPDIYAQDWLEQLVIHEARHIKQVDLLNQNFTRFLYYILGEQAESAIMGVFLPLWFLEGDAVTAETAMSNAGRGRSPSFTKEMKVRILADKKFSYNKSVFGSYKQYVPDHYRFGYVMTAYMSKKYDYSVWDKTILKISKNPIGISRFNNSLYSLIKTNKVAYYNKMLKDLKKDYLKCDTVKYDNSYELLGNYNDNSDYINYYNPQFLNSETIIAERFSFDKILSYISIDKGHKETRIITPGYALQNTLSVSDSLLCWIEQKPDKRWENRSYNVIFTYDLNSKKKKQITKKTRYFSASLSPDSKKIACIEISEENLYSLIILDSRTGKVLDKISFPSNNLLLQPSWSEDEKKIVLLVLSNEGKSINLVNINNHTITKISENTFVDISRPKLYKNYVLFTGAFNGTENIYAFDTSKHDLFQLTNSRFGASNVSVSPNQQKIVYNEFMSNGTKIATINIDKLLWKKIKFNKIYNDDFTDNLSKNFSNPYLTNVDTLGLFKIKKYSKLGHLINIHSWAPLYMDANNPTAVNRLGLSLMSQNMLSTAITTVGYGINNNSGNGEWKAGFAYKGFYPQINFDYTLSNQRDTIFRDGDSLVYNWTRQEISTGISIPIIFNVGCFSNGINTSINNSILNASFPETKYTYSSTTNIFSMNYKLLLYSLRKTAYRDLYPRIGQVFQLTYSHTPFKSSSYNASIRNLRSVTYLPSIFKHHHIITTLGFQQKYGDYIIFSDLISFPQGYYNLKNKNMFAIMVDYAMPLCYPDFSLGGLLYVKRIKTKLFYNYAKTWQQTLKANYESKGFDLTAEVHLFRFLFPVEIGVKVIKTLESNQIWYEPIINLNINELGRKLK